MIIICLKEDIFMLNLMETLGFMYMDVHISPKGWEVFNYYFNKITVPFFIFFPSGNCILQNFVCLMISHRSHRRCLLFFILSSFFSSFLSFFKRLVFKFKDSENSCFTRLLLTSSIVFFVSLVDILCYKISVL